MHARRLLVLSLMPPLLSCSSRAAAFTRPLLFSIPTSQAVRRCAGSLSAMCSNIQTYHPLQTSESSLDVKWRNPSSIHVVLGSKSFTRQLLLKEMDVEYECFPANIDEKAIRSEDPEQLVLALANAKADALLQRHCKDGKWTGSEQAEDGKITLLLTSDQVVVHEGRILEKPADEEEARSFISGYGRSPPSTVGAIAVTNVASGKRAIALDKATIVFKLIPSEVIEEIVKDEMTLHCAGGLMVEDPRIQPYLVKIEGGMDSVMGLGKRTARSLLESVLE